MTSRRAAACTPLTLFTLAFGHVPTYLAVEAGGLAAVLLGALILAADARSVPQRVLLLICLLLRIDATRIEAPSGAAGQEAGRSDGPDSSTRPAESGPAHQSLVQSESRRAS